MPKDKLTIGLCGCGEIAVAHANGITKASNAELRMVMDVNEEAAKELGERYQVPWTTSLEELLATEGLDAVSIATPHYLHAPIARESAKAKKHVMVEKPMAISVEECDEMIEACKENGVSLTVWYVLRYLPEIVKAKELVDKGVIGEVTAIKMTTLGYKPETYWQHGVSGKARATDWRAYKSKAGGGILIMNTVHQIDQLYYITGLRGKRVYAEADILASPEFVEVEDMISVTVRYENEAIGSIIASSAAPGGAHIPDRIIGHQGQIVLTNPLQVYTMKEFEGLEKDKWNEVALESRGDTRKIFVEEFAEAVLEGRKPPVTGEDGKVALEIISAAYRSAESRQVIELKG